MKGFIFVYGDSDEVGDFATACFVEDVEKYIEDNAPNRFVENQLREVVGWAKEDGFGLIDEGHVGCMIGDKTPEQLIELINQHNELSKTEEDLDFSLQMDNVSFEMMVQNPGVIFFESR